MHQISWFQFLPQESDFNSLPDTRFSLDSFIAISLNLLKRKLKRMSTKLLDIIYLLIFRLFLHFSFWYFCSANVDMKDAMTMLVLSSHLQLQKEGFLSAWTNSFVGPWDPSQGQHNPGKYCKLYCERVMKSLFFLLLSAHIILQMRR